MTTIVTCGDINSRQTVNGVSNASCSLTGTDLSTTSATASFGIYPYSPYSVSAQTAVGGPWSVLGPNATATAILDADLTFTIFGSTGLGYVVPNFSLADYADPEQSSGAESDASLGSYGDSQWAPGSRVGSGQPMPFTFGVPFTLHLHLEVDAGGSQLDFPGECYCGGGSGTAEFNGIGVNLANGQPFYNAQYTMTEAVPEPSSLPLMMAGTALLFLKRLW